MNGFRVLVVDDEPLARGMVGAIVQADPDVAWVIECGDARQVARADGRARPHIVFLDIEMPELTGIASPKMFDDAGPAIVFVTAFSQYATRAFDVKAIDYVLKPFSDDRLRDALERAKRRIRERRLGELAHELSSLSANLPDRPPPAPDGGAKSYLQRLALQGRRSIRGAEDRPRSTGSRPRTTTCCCTPRAAVTWSGCRWPRSKRSSIPPSSCARTAPRSSTSTRSRSWRRRTECLRLIDGTRVPVSRSRRRHVEAAIGARG